MTTDNRNEGDGCFIYRGEGRGCLPRDVTRVKVHQSIKAIKDKAFCQCSKLTIVNLGKGLEEIESVHFGHA